MRVRPVLLVLGNWGLPAHLYLHGPGQEQLLRRLSLHCLVHAHARAAWLVVALSSRVHHRRTRLRLALVRVVQLLNVVTVTSVVCLVPARRLNSRSTVTFLSIERVAVAALTN